MLVPAISHKSKLAELMPLKWNLLILRRHMFLGRDFCLIGKEQNQQKGFQQVPVSWACHPRGTQGCLGFL